MPYRSNLPPSAAPAERPEIEPLVSVIVPVRNRPEALRRCLLALNRQTYPAERREAIVVDNGSDVDLRPVCAEFPGIQLIREEAPGSYAARNAGIRAARGSILAFTDSDCEPDTAWIAHAVAELSALRCDALAGRIEYSKPAKGLNMFEIFEERVFKLDDQRVFVSRQYAATANLIVPRATFDFVGLFDASMNSLGDIEWGKRLAKKGLLLAFSPAPLVIHPRRGTHREILLKIKRASGGRHQVRLREGRYLRAFYELVRDCPVSPRPFLFAFSCPGIPNGTGRFRFAAAVWQYSAMATWQRLRVFCGRPAFRGD